MKRFLSLIILFSFIFSLSLPVFAAVAPVKVSISSVPNLGKIISNDGFYHSAGPFSIANQNVGSRNVWLQLMSDFNGENPNRVSLLLCSAWDSGFQLVFYSFERESSYPIEAYVSPFKDTYALKISASNFNKAEFTFDASGKLTRQYIHPLVATSQFYFSERRTKMLSYRNIVLFQSGYDFTSISHPSHNYPVYYTDEIASLQILDDLAPPEPPPPDVYNLTINYQHENGSTAAPPHTEAIENNLAFSVTSPVIDGYTASAPVVSGKIVDSDSVYTVTYTKNTTFYDLTINYQYENGSTAASPHTEAIENNLSFSVTSPVIDGYTASASVVSGKIVDSDSVYTVTYTKNTTFYDLTIHYRYEDDTQASPSYSARLSDGEAFSVRSPYVENFIASHDSVVGTMSGLNVTRVVYYTPKGATENPSNVYIPWDASLFGQGMAGLLANAGTAINVGLWIFLIITGIYLAIKIINGLSG